MLHTQHTGRRSVGVPGTSRVAVLAATMAAALLGTVAVTSGPATAGTSTVLRFDSVGIGCEAFPDGQPQVNVWLHRDGASGESEAGAEVYTADGEGHLASGYTSDLTLADGVVAATFPLSDETGGEQGHVVLRGTYQQASSPVTSRERFRYARNGLIVGTSTYTPRTAA